MKDSMEVGMEALVEEEDEVMELSNSIIEKYWEIINVIVQIFSHSVTIVLP